MRALFFIIVCCCIVGAAATVYVSVKNNFNEYAERDVTFESSDGVWSDRTVKIKGRDFRAMLYYFETYKIGRNKPEVTLVRVTPVPKETKGEAEWKVPFSNPSGHAFPITTITTDEQKEEIRRRVEADLAYWQNR